MRNPVSLILISVTLSACATLYPTPRPLSLNKADIIAFLLTLK